jgi:membrane associated rhomboid family serine protease
MTRYYGGSEFRFNVGMTDAVKWLIIANVIAFLLQRIGVLLGGVDYVGVFFGLNRTLVFRGMIWQPVTYMFLHGNLLHILINMFVLWMFGTSLEATWGPKSFLRYYFLTGIGAGLLSLVADIITGSTIPTVGASGAIFGLLVAFGMVFPDRIILAFFIVPMRAKHFVLLIAGIELLVTLEAGPYGGRVARFAHIGGMLIGYLYLKYWDRLKYSIPRIRFNTGTRRQSKTEDWEGFMNEEVDPILDKISKEGIHALTRKERRILKKARGRRKDGS